jgi:hypothetical protein
MIAGAVLACETLFQLMMCSQADHKADGSCTKFLRVADTANVTADEYIHVILAFVVASGIVAGSVAGLVRKFGWVAEEAEHWRLNSFGIIMPWIGGLILVIGVFYLRGH